LAEDDKKEEGAQLIISFHNDAEDRVDDEEEELTHKAANK